jgi:hypothetical protein
MAHWVLRSLVLLPCLLHPLNQGRAAEIRKLAGHAVEVKEADTEKSLTVDGRELHRNQLIFLDDIYGFASTLIVVGSSSAGGNACDSAPFVLSFPNGGAPRFDGPLETCMSVDHQVEGSEIVFSSAPIPGRETERWKWTLESGFQSLGSKPFVPEAADWSSLRERRLSHPADAFRNAGIMASISKTLGRDFNHFQQLMTGVGSGEFKGDDFLGSACRPHACMDEAGLLFLSAHDRRVFAAWKPEGQKIVVYPSPVKDWPDKAKNELRAWAKKWS